MSISTIKGKTVDAKLWIPALEVETPAVDQIKNICSLPWVAHVAVMPDVHLGKGATVGSVIAMRGAVSPAAVGVDIGCGMCAVRTSLTAKQIDAKDAKHLFNCISDTVPVGFGMHDEPALDRLLDPDLKENARQHLESWKNLRAPQELLEEDRIVKQLGSLGSGNHFIEICIDEEDRVWIMLHSGSRNIGVRLAEHHMAIAMRLDHNADLPDRGLAAFLSETPEMDAYRHDLMWAQTYAKANRLVMMDLIKQVLIDWRSSITFEETISCHHNYVEEESHFGENLIVTRKGAISARVGQKGIIPGSMGTRSYIVEGLGNEESLCSASHGAGRKMSRSKAKAKYTRRDLEDMTRGVVCRKDNGVLDEIPAAYKKIEKVMSYQTDLVRVLHDLKQIVCVKG